MTSFNNIPAGYEHVDVSPEPPTSYEFFDDRELCPKHGCETVMAEYGNVDAGYACPKCQDDDWDNGEY